MRAAFRTILLCAMPLLWQGCIKEDRSHCFRTCDLRIEVDVDGVDVTGTGVVAGATLLFFDAQKRFVESIEMSGDQIKGYVPVQYTIRSGQWCYVSVWGNLDAAENMTLPPVGGDIGRGGVGLIKDTEGYVQTPDNLFFGTGNPGGMPQSSRVEQSEIIRISPLNAMMNITATGLPAGASADDYFFEIELGYDGYTLEGEPVPGDCVMKQNCVPDGSMPGSVGTDGAFCLPNSQGGIQGRTVTVLLYRKTLSGPELVATTRNDDRDTVIELRAGLTTNVLLRIDSGSRLTVQTVITPWGRIHQWETV